MPSSTRLHTLSEYLVFAASTVKDISGSGQIPFLHSTAVLSLAILESVENVRSNKEQCIQMVEEIHEVLCSIIGLCTTSETWDALPPETVYDIGKFTETLQKIYTFTKSQQGTSKLKQLFNLSNTSLQIQECRNGLRDSLDAFRIRTGTSMIVEVARMQKDIQRQHEALLALLDSRQDLVDPERFSLTSGTVASRNSSSSAMSLLPPSPQIFHGREQELADLLHMLTQNTPRAVILGPGGIGKTSLASAALHHSQINTKYSRCYFISCQSTDTCTSLVANIATHLGLPQSQNPTRKIVHHFRSSDPCLLVLDNFETPWELIAFRAEVEEFLSLLADISHLGILVTMRGTECPGKVKWSRPFLPPLKPLTYLAALQTFTDIAEDQHDEDIVRELLNLTGNLPLAVSLVANVVAYEGCDYALARWRSESTQVLSDGYDKSSNLDASITISFTSSRMTSDAQQLLSLLSILPNGLSDTDLTQSGLQIPNILKCKAILIQTSLAYSESQHLKCLVPIREYVWNRCPPSPSLKFAMRQHFHKMVKLWDTFRNLPSRDIVVHISENMGNINSILKDALHTECPDATTNIRSAMLLNNFSRVTMSVPSPLMADVSTEIENWQGNDVYDAYLIQSIDFFTYLPVPDVENKILIGMKHFQNADKLQQAKWFSALGTYYRSFMDKENMTKALDSFKLCLELVTSGEKTNNIIAAQTLRHISDIVCLSGDPVGALEYAKNANKFAQYAGDIKGLAQGLNAQAFCYTECGDLSYSAQLCKSARDLLKAVGLQGGNDDVLLQARLAEIHTLKTEYQEARAIHANNTVTNGPPTPLTAFAYLNVALIDISTGSPPEMIRNTLDMARKQFKIAFASPLGVLYCDMAGADLCLLNGDIQVAKQMFERIFTSFRHTFASGARICLERLANTECGLCDLTTTSQWAVIYLAHSVRSKSMLHNLKAIQLMAKLAIIEGDDDTGMFLFQTALDGFTVMDIHQWRANSMLHIANIIERQGDIAEAVKWWTAAIPLFERASQAKSVAWLNSKLALVDEKSL